MSDEDRIRETYREYGASGREHLWDGSNQGYARLVRDRDAALLTLVGRSLGSAPAPRLLDVGCGDGSFVAQIQSAFPTVDAWGLDLLEDRIAVAKRRAPLGRFVVGSATAMPIQDAEFDLVTALTMFSSLPDAGIESAVAREIGRGLRPGGWLIWYDMRVDNPSNSAVHGVSRGRLRDLFPGWQSEIMTITLAPPIARRLGPITPIAYPLLHALPVARSHLVGRLRRPE